WKNVYSWAFFARVMSRSPPKVLSEKWEIGSATLKYKSPIPIPAAKSMAIQEKNECSGSASLSPSLIEPYLLKTRNTRKNTKMVRDHTYTQFRLINIHSCTMPSIAAARLGTKLETRLTDRIKIKLGTTTPLLKVLLAKNCLNVLIVMGLVP